MLKRLKNLWKLSGKTPQKDIIVVNRSSMRPEEAEKLSRATGKVVIFADDVNDFNTFDLSEIKVKGDGKAEFLGEGSTEEYEDMVREDEGTLSWYERLKRL